MFCYSLTFFPLVIYRFNFFFKPIAITITTTFHINFITFYIIFFFAKHWTVNWSFDHIASSNTPFRSTLTLLAVLWVNEWIRCFRFTTTAGTGTFFWKWVTFYVWCECAGIGKFITFARVDAALEIVELRQMMMVMKKKKLPWEEVNLLATFSPLILLCSVLFDPCTKVETK